MNGTSFLHAVFDAECAATRRIPRCNPEAMRQPVRERDASFVVANSGVRTPYVAALHNVKYYIII